MQRTNVDADRVVDEASVENRMASRVYTQISFSVTSLLLVI